VAVDPEIQSLLDVIAAAPSIELTPDGAPLLRTTFAAMGQLMGPGPESVTATDDSFPGPAGEVAIRIYHPSDGGPAEVGARPGLVWFHGGGFVIGDLDTADAECRRLCEATGVVVVSVDYRLAPEHPHPAAVDDCLAATRWVAAHAAAIGIDPSRLAVGGDSAGGNLAAVVAQQCRGVGPDLAFQLLVYPVTDLASELGDTPYPSMAENAEGYFLTAETMRWFADRYVPDGVDPADPTISPLRASSLEGLPPALVLTCGYDPLRDEGRAYAAALEAAGVPVECHCEESGIHGLLAMSAIAAIGRDFVGVACDGLRDGLGTSPAVS
jgi:acetyl esterase